MKTIQMAGVAWVVGSVLAGGCRATLWPALESRGGDDRESAADHAVDEAAAPATADDEAGE